MNFKFTKRERLCSKKVIEGLFDSGKELKAFPFRLVYSVQPHCGVSMRVVISVPKRNHKRAVVRNLLKRRIREAYRLNKHALNLPAGEQYTVNCMIIYVSTRISEYGEIERKLVEALEKLAKRVAEDCDISGGVVD